jgi:TRAP-type C4-dicarboxylate transport system substrate-binding protein
VILRLLVGATAMLFFVAPAQALTLKIATIAPEGSAWMRDMREVAQHVEEQTEGRVRFKFYPGGVMGNDQTVLRKIRAGQLQGGAFTAGALAQIYPDIVLYGIPLLFHSYDEVDYVRERVDADVIAGLEKKGFVALAITDGGFAYVMSQRPLRRVNDLREARIWSREADPMSATAFEIADVSPVQLPLADVYTALQTRLIDTIVAPPMAAIALQWHTKVKYLTDVPLTYLNGVFAIDARAFRKLRPDDRKLVRRAVREAAERQDTEARLGEEGARRALRDQGIAFVSAATPEEEERWHDIMRRALVVLREKRIYSDERIDQIQRHLEEYRSRAREGSDG